MRISKQVIDDFLLKIFFYLFFPCLAKLSYIISNQEISKQCDMSMI